MMVGLLCFGPTGWALPVTRETKEKKKGGPISKKMTKLIGQTSD